MKVLVACEFSGIVREAFRERGHDAWSCDLLPTEIPSKYHIQNDVMNLTENDWDLMIAHPPCTYLAVSGARWFKEYGRKKKQTEAIRFVKALYAAEIPKIAIENPISVLSTQWKKPDQIIQPWQFGCPELKTTCLWLKHLPLLLSTNIVNQREPRVHLEPPSKDRWKNRSRTPWGIAEAMAEQWGNSA